MRYVELFAGAGGLSMGLELAGMTSAAHAEIDPHARAVLRHHWRDTPLYGDVAKVNGAVLGDFDLLSGGSPCQDLSVAGKRAGMTEGSGTRSSLFFEQVRIWRESPAPFFLWENVYGAFSSSKGRDFAAVLSALVGRTIAVPRDGWRRGGVAAGRAGVAAWRVLDAQFFGVPQRRRRVFVLCSRTRSVDPAEVLALSESVCGDTPQSKEAGQGLADDAAYCIRGTIASGRSVERGGPSGAGGDTGTAYTLTAAEEHAVLAVRTAQTSANGHGVASNVCDTLDGAQGQAVLAFHATQTPISGTVAPRLGATASIGTVVSDTVTAKWAKGSGGPSGSVLPLRPDHPTTDWPFLTRSAHRQNMPDKGNAGVVIVFPPLSAEDATKWGSNQWVKEGKAVDNGLPTGIVKTMNGLRAWSAQTAADGYIQPMTNGIPRRLTPRECERLMGWPDDHTARGVNEKGVEYALSDSARYRLCGNGVASPCAAWIGFRLMVAA